MKNLELSTFYELISEKLDTWLQIFITMLPNMVMALLVFGLFILLARALKKLSFKLSDKLSDNQALNRLISTIVFISVVGIGIFTALSLLHLDKALTSLLTGAGIIGLALSFAFQDSAANFISGIFMAARKPFHIGDIIESDGSMGTVDKMNLRNTVLLSFQGQYIYIPNKEVYQNKLINYSKLGKRRIDIAVGVSYGDDLKKAQNIGLDTVRSLPFVIDKEEASFLFDEFGDSSINGKLRLWIEYVGEVGYLEAQSRAIMAVKKAFDENDITIPFPIRTLDFGIKGGEKLSTIVEKDVA